MKRALAVWVAALALCVVVPAAGAQPADPATADAGVGGADPDAAGPIFIPPEVIDSPDAPQVRAAVSTGSVQVGATFTLFITVTSAPGAEVNIPSALDFHGAFEEVRRTRGDRKTSDGRRVREFEIELMGWFVGDQMIPPVPVTYVIGGAAHTTQTNAVPVTIVGVIGEGEATLRDVAPPVEVTRPDWTIIWITIIVGACVAAVAVVLVAVFFMRRGRRTHAPRKRGIRTGPPLAPDLEALGRLDELEASGALEADDLEPAFTELSEIVRSYLGRRYGFPALDSTSSEIRAQLRRRVGTEAALEILDDWMRLTDMVKYAGYQPAPDEARAAMTDARQVVAVTPAPVATPLAAASPVPVPAPSAHPETVAQDGVEGGSTRSPLRAARLTTNGSSRPCADELDGPSKDAPEPEPEPEPDPSDTLRGVVAVRADDDNPAEAGEDADA
jgi:hypothetical protein